MDAIQQQASLYVGFMTALAGMALTALTLVLALDRERVDARIFLLLPAALISATISATVGANLMLSIGSLPASSSVPSTAGPTAPVSGDMRLYLIAMTTVHTAGALVLFTLMLLPAVYDVQGGTRMAQQLGFWSFLLLEGAGMVAIVQVMRDRNHPVTTAAIAVSGGLAAALILWFARRQRDPGESADLFPFILCTAATCAAAVFYALTYDQRHPVDTLDVWFFCLASTLPVSALIGLGIRIHRDEFAEPGRGLRATAPSPAASVRQPAAAVSAGADRTTRVEGAPRDAGG